MFVKARDPGCKGKVSLILLFVNIIIAFCLAVITAHLANTGCSRAFAAVAIMSFVYIVINFLLIILQTAWNRCFSFIFLFLIFVIFIVTLVGLGYAGTQSVCNVITCVSNLQSTNDDFHSWFREKDRKKDFEDKYCKTSSDQVISDYIGGQMARKSNEQADDVYYMMKGWPIAFTCLQFMLALLQFFLIYFNLFSCSGCKPQKKETQQISYF